MKKKADSLESKRSKDIMPLNEALFEMMDVYKIRQKFEESKIIAKWEEVIGKTIASRTTKIFIKDKKLFLGIDSAALKHQLTMSKTKLLEVLNEGHADRVVTEIKFL